MRVTTLRIAEGLEQFVGQDGGRLQQTAASVGDVVQQHRCLSVSVLTGVRADRGALPGAGIQRVDPERNRIRPKHVAFRLAQGMVGHVCDQHRIDECRTAGRGAVARMVGEEGERAEQLVDDFTRLSELQVHSRPVRREEWA